MVETISVWCLMLRCALVCFGLDEICVVLDAYKRCGVDCMCMVMDAEVCFGLDDMCVVLDAERSCAVVYTICVWCLILRCALAYATSV